MTSSFSTAFVVPSRVRCIAVTGVRLCFVIVAIFFHYENKPIQILKILPPKNENFQITKKSDIFHISAQNIDCRYSLEPHRRGGSNEYPQSMFLSCNKENNVYPCKPQFYYIKVGFKGVKIIWACFPDGKRLPSKPIDAFSVPSIDIGLRCRPRSDATERCVWYKSTLQ